MNGWCKGAADDYPEFCDACANVAYAVDRRSRTESP